MRAVKKGSTDQSVVVRIVDSADGTPETGVVYNTSGIDLWYRRDGAVKTSITEATLADASAAHSDGGFVHIGDGYYRLDPPDAAFATGVNGVLFGGTVTGMVVIGCYVPLVANDPQDADGLGLSRVDAAVTTRLAPTTAGRTLDVSAAGNAGIDWSNVEAPTTVLVLSGTTVGTVTTLTGHTAQSGDAFARIGAAGAGLTAVPWNAAWDAEVESEVTDALEARGYTATVSGRIDAAISTRLASASYSAPPSAASIRAEIDTNSVGLQAIYARTDVATSTRLASGSYTAPLDSTATQAAAAAALTAYDPPTRAEATSDKDAVIAALPAAPDNVSIAAIKAKTDGLPSDPADASVLAGRFDAVDVAAAAIKAKTDALPSDPADASVIAGRFDTLDAAVAAVKVDTAATRTDAAAIKVVTDRLSAMLELDGSVYRFTVNALEQGPSGGGGGGGVTEQNITDIVDAVFAQAIEVGGPTFLQVQRVMAAMLTGVCSGANASTTLFKAIGSTTKVRVTMATDTDTNRVSVTLDYAD